MVAAFRHYLDDVFNNDVLKMNEPLSVDRYRQMFKDTNTHVKYVKPEKQGEERSRLVWGQCPTAPALVADLVPPAGNKNEKLSTKMIKEMGVNRKRLVIYPEERERKGSVEQKLPKLDGVLLIEYYNMKRADSANTIDSLPCENWTPVLMDVFQRFEDDMRMAPTRIHQLQAIARVIRRVHMLNIFTEGNTRVNIHLLLSHLLLKYRFGLPLGGKYRQEFERPQALDEMFQGGYTVEQIAQFLWIAQDFGRLSNNKADTILHQDSSKGNGPPGHHDANSDNKGSPSPKQDKNGGGDDKKDVHHKPESSGTDHGRISHNAGSGKETSVNHHHSGAKDPSKDTNTGPEQTDSSTQPKLVNPPASHVDHDSSGSLANQKNPKVDVSKTTNISHNGKRSHVFQNGSQTTITHNGTQSGINHSGSLTTIAHNDPSGKASTTPGNLVHVLVNHSDGSHTTVTHARGQTTIMHHNPSQPLLSSTASLSNPQHESSRRHASAGMRSTLS